MKRIAVFASGTGTNFEAIADAIEAGQLNAEITLVVVDKPGAPVIEKAQKRGIDVFAFNPKDYPSKPDYEREVIDRCQAHGVEWIALAGYCLLYTSRSLGNPAGSIRSARRQRDAVRQAAQSRFRLPDYDRKADDAGRGSRRRNAEENRSLRHQSDLIPRQGSLPSGGRPECRRQAAGTIPAFH